MDDIRAAFARQGLYRSTDRNVFGGVCAGLGARLGIQPWPARLLFVILLLAIPGSQILIYPVLWVLMPAALQTAPAETYGQAPAPWTT